MSSAIMNSTSSRTDRVHSHCADGLSVTDDWRQPSQPAVSRCQEEQEDERHQTRHVHETNKSTTSTSMPSVSVSSSSAPRIQRVVNDVMSSNGLTINPGPRNHTPVHPQSHPSDEPLGFDPPATSPSITDKLRNLKLRSRGGRGPSISIPMGGLGPTEARNTRAASAFVRRQPTEDEIEHLTHPHEPGRSVSNLSHYPMGSQTPSTKSAKNQPFSERFMSHDREKEFPPPIDPISTNSSYESIHGGTLASLHSRQRRRPPPMAESSLGKGQAVSPSSPSSANSANSFSSAYSNNMASLDRISSASPLPLERESSGPHQSQLRRPRFTSEPVQPPAHLQINSPIHQSHHTSHQHPQPQFSPLPQPSPPPQQQQTAFGAARHAHHASLSMASNASSNGSVNTNSITPLSSYAQHYAQLMDEADEHQDGDYLSHTPYSSAFDSARVASPSFGPSVQRHAAGSPTSLSILTRRAASPSLSQYSGRTQSPFTNYDDRPIGGTGGRHMRSQSDEYDHEEFEPLPAASPQPHVAHPVPMTPADRAAATAAAVSKWELAAAQAAAMGMEPLSAGSNSSNSSQVPGSASAKRKPLIRSKPSLSIPPSPASSNPLSSPPLVSPIRPRNPRVSITPQPAGAVAPGQDEGVYVLSCDLTPAPSPATELPNILKSLQSSDWSVRFDGITNIRRMMVHHSQLLPPHTKALVRDLRAEVNSLRSSLAKNAIMALADFFTNCAKSVEPELEQVGPPLLKRAGEPSGFLRDEAHRALILMLQHCSDKYTLPFLLNVSSTGTKVLKTMACVYLDRAVEFYGARSNNGSTLQCNKEWSRLLKAIGIFSSDAAVESRTHSRWSLIRLARFVGLEELDRTMKKLLPAAHYHAVNKVLSKGMDQLNTELPSSNGLSPAFSPSSIASSPSSKRSQHSSFSLPSSSLASDFSGYEDELASASGLDSVSRNKRRMRPASHLVSTSAGSSVNASIEKDQLGWNSIKSTASTSTSTTVSMNSISHTGGSGNMFDLDVPEYNAPTVSSSQPTPSSAQRSSAKRRPTTILSSAPAISPADQERLTATLTDLGSSDWRTRMSGLEDLKAFIQSNSQGTAANIVKIYDMLGQRINDHHGKVNVAALQSLTQIIPLTKVSQERNIWNVDCALPFHPLTLSFLFLFCPLALSRSCIGHFCSFTRH